MIKIEKGPEPPELTRLRKRAEQKRLKPKEAYASMKTSVKKIVRSSLVHEQGQICAYCMCRIPRKDLDPGVTPIIIEHFIPRNPLDGRDVGQGLDYNNLLAVCNGNVAASGKRKKIDLTCDAHRGNTEFRKVDPCHEETLESIYYRMDGSIQAADADVRHDLQSTLNLNCRKSPLISERKAALDSLIADMGTVDIENLEEYCRFSLEVFEAEKDPKTPYAGVLIWYLKSMLQSLNGGANL